MNKITSPVIRILPGKAGIIAAYEESLKAKDLRIKCMSSGYASVLGLWFDDSYAPRLYGKVKTRELVPDTAGNRSDAARKDPSVNTVRFLDPAMASETDFMVFDTTVIFVSFNPDGPFALVITDEETARSLRNEFDFVWENAGK